MSISSPDGKCIRAERKRRGERVETTWTYSLHYGWAFRYLCAAEVLIETRFRIKR
jgi:hypothetical protein